MAPKITLTLTAGAILPAWDTPDGTAGDKWHATAHGYTATLHHGSRTMTVPYWTGSGWKEHPTAADVLEALASEVIEDGTTFEEWCRDFGYDTDSRRALAMYEACKQTGPKLRELLSYLYTDLVEHTRDEWPLGIVETTQPETAPALADTIGNTIPEEDA